MRLIAGLLLGALITTPSWAADAPGLGDAVEARDYAAIERLLKTGPLPPPLLQGNDAQLYTHPLATAISARDERAVKLLLDAGVGKGELARFLLLLERSPNILALLLDHGLDPNARVIGMPLLNMAAMSDDPASVSVLIRRGAALNGTLDRGDTALHSAIGSKIEVRAQLVEQLLKAGVDARTRNAEGQTALHLAARAADAKAIDLLLARGLGMQDTDAAGISALGYLYGSSRSASLHGRFPREALSEADRLFAMREALEGEQLDAFTLLLRPQDVRQHPEWFKLCVSSNNHRMLHALLSLGADPALANDDGTPHFIEKLLDSGQDGQLIARMLIAAGARVPSPLSMSVAARIAYLDATDGADKIAWLQLAGVSLSLPLTDEDSNRSTFQRLLEDAEAESMLQAWRKPLPAELKSLQPTHGAAWQKRRADLVGTWADADSATKWSFGSDGRFTGFQEVLFAQDRSRGRWSLSDAALVLEVESDKPGTRTLVPLLWVGDELTLVNGLGPLKLQRVAATASDVAGPAKQELGTKEVCRRAGASFAEAAEQIKALLAAGEDNETPQRGAMEKLAAIDPRTFEAACVHDYDSNPYVQRLAQCLLDLNGMVGLIGCVGIAQEGGDPSGSVAAPVAATPAATAVAPFVAIALTAPEPAAEDAAPELLQFVRSYQMASSATNLRWYEQGIFADAITHSVDTTGPVEIKEQWSKADFMQRIQTALPMFRFGSERCSRVKITVSKPDAATLERACVSLAQLLQPAAYVSTTSEVLNLEQREGHWGIAGSDVRSISLMLFQTDAEYQSGSRVFKQRDLEHFLAGLEDALAGDYSAQDTRALLDTRRLMLHEEEHSIVLVHSLGPSPTPLQLHISAIGRDETRVTYTAAADIFPQIEALVGK